MSKKASLKKLDSKENITLTKQQIKLLLEHQGMRLCPREEEIYEFKNKIAKIYTSYLRLIIKTKNGVKKLFYFISFTVFLAFLIDILLI